MITPSTARWRYQVSIAALLVCFTLGTVACSTTNNNGNCDAQGGNNGVTCSGLTNTAVDSPSATGSPLSLPLSPSPPPPSSLPPSPPAEVRPASAATVTQVLIYPGSGQTAVGPVGPLTSAWTLSAQPSEITTTNDGTLVEDTGIVANCAPFPTDCGTWRYHKGGAQLMDFNWERPNGAGTVMAINLLTITNDSNAWINAGSVYYPKCLQWVYGSNYYVIGLNVSNHTWSGMTQAQCDALPSQ